MDRRMAAALVDSLNKGEHQTLETVDDRGTRYTYVYGRYNWGQRYYLYSFGPAGVMVHAEGVGAFVVVDDMVREVQRVMV